MVYEKAVLMVGVMELWMVACLVVLMAVWLAAWMADQRVWMSVGPMAAMME